MRLYRSRSIAGQPGVVTIAAVLAAVHAVHAVAPARALGQTQAPLQPVTETPPAIKPMPAVAVPSAAQIVERYVEALGGEAALRKVTSRVDVGSIQMVGITADFKSITAAPDRRVIVVSSKSLGEQVQGFDGTVAWDVTSAGARVLSGPELAYRALTCDFYRPLNLATRFNLRVMGIEDRDGKPCHKVGATPIADAPKPGAAEVPGAASTPEPEKPKETTLFFDTETGLLVGQIVMRPTANGDMGVDTTYAEFKKFGDILVPTKATSKVGSSVQSVTVTGVEFNTVPANSFEIPPTVRALLAKPGASATKPADPASSPKK